MRTLLILFIVLCLKPVVSQNPIMFQHTYGNFDYNYGMCVKQMSDSGYVVLANVSPQDENTNVYLFKIDPWGNYVWDKLYADTAIFWAEKMEATPDGGFVITGYTNKLSGMGYSIFVMKTDEAGNKEWLRYYGGSDWDFGMDITADAYGNYYVTGATYSYGIGERDVYTLKLNGAGDTLWTRTFGGINDESGKSIIVCQNGDIVVAGYTNSMGAGGYDALLLRYTSDGQLLWSKTYGDLLDEKTFDVKELKDSTFITIGYSESYGNGSAYYYFFKTTKDGQLEWYKTSGWNNGDFGDDYGIALDLAYDTGFVFVGTSTFNVYQDLFLLKTHFDGSWHFSTSHGGWGKDDANYIIQTYDSCFIIVGTSEWFGKNLNNIYVVKTGLDGITSPYNNVESVETENNTKAIIYPNPFNNYANVELNINNAKGYRFVAFNTLGQKVFEEAFDSHSTILLDSRNFKPGIYFYNILDNSKTHDKGSFVVY